MEHACQPFREAISARLDGEPLGMPPAELDGHLAVCPECARLGGDAAAVTRRARLAAAPPVPDLTAAVLAALPRELPGAAAAARARLVDSALRLALLAVGVAQAGLAWPALASGQAAMSAPVHMAHETGAWSLDSRPRSSPSRRLPRLAAGTLPFLGTFTALLVPVTLRDLAAGHVHADRAAVHLLLLVGLPSWCRWPGGAVVVGPVRSRAGGWPREAGPAAPAHPARRLVPRRHRHGRPGVGARDADLHRSGGGRPAAGGAGGGHPRVQRGRLARARVRPGPRLRRGARRRGDGVGRRRRRSPSRCAAACPTTATWSPTGSSRPTRTRSPAPTRSSSGTANSCRPSAASTRGPHRPGRRRRPAAAALDRVRRPRPGRRGAGPRAGLLAGRLGSARLRRMATWGAVAVAVAAAASFLFQGPYAAASGPGVAGRPLPAGRDRRLGCGLGAAGPDRAGARPGRAAAPVWRRGETPSTGRVVAGRRPRGGPGDQHRRDRAPGRRALAVARRRRHRRARRGDGGLARRPRRPAGRRAAAGDPGRTRWPRRAPLLAARVRRRWRRSSSAAPCRPSARSSRRPRCSSPPTAGCSWPSSSSSPSCSPRPGSRGSGCSSGSGCAAPGPAAPQPHRARLRGASGPRRRRSAEDAGRRRAPPACSRRAPPSTCPRCAARCSSSWPWPPSILALSAVLVGPPPARAAVAQPVDATAAAAGRRRPAGSVQVSVDPARPGRNTLHLYLFDDAGQLTQPAGDHGQPHRGAAADRPAGRRARSRPAPATTSATAWTSPAPAPGPSPSSVRARRVHRHDRQHRLPGALTARAIPPMNRSSVSLPRPLGRLAVLVLATLTAARRPRYRAASPPPTSPSPPPTPRPAATAS